MSELSPLTSLNGNQTTGAPIATSNGQYTGGQAVPAPGTPEYAQAQANASKTASPSTPSPASDGTIITPSNPTGMDTTSYMGFMNSLNTNLQQNNALVDQKNLITKQLFDQPLTPDEIKKLPPEMQSVISGGNQDQMKLQLKIINDTLQGRNDSVAKSIGFLTTSYEQNQQDTRTALANLETYATNNGLKLGDLVGAMAPIVGKSVADQLQKNLSALNYPYIKSGLQAVSGGPGSYSVTIPSGSIASQTNNPLNIKYSDTVSTFGAQNSGVTAQDGGTFSSFNSPEAGLQAGIKLLKSDVYANLTVDQAMKKWSNNGYGADVSPSLNPNQTVGSLSDSQLQQLTSDMATRESGSSVKSSASDELQGMLDIYHTTGVIPPMGLSASGLRTQFYAAIGKEGPGAVSDASANKAEIAGATTALRTQTNQYAANQTSIGTLDKQLDLVQSYSDKVDRTGSPLFNKYLLYLKGSVAGDADTAAFQNIVNTASAEFAKILSGSSASIAGVTVSSQQDAKNLLNASMSADQLSSVIGLMKAESNYRLTSQKDSINTLTSDIKNIGNGKMDTSTSSPTDAASFFQSKGINYTALKKDNPNVSDSDLIAQFNQANPQ